MAISFVQSAVGSSSPNAQTSVTISAATAGDLIVVAFGVGDSTGTDNDISLSGYTEISDLFIGTDTQDVELWVGYKVAVGGETTVGPFTALGGTNAANAAVVMVFRGVDTSNPIDTAASTATGIDTSNANPPSHNHSGTAGVWTVIAAATGHTGGATASFTFPAGYTTNAAQRTHDDTNDVLVGLGYNSAPSDPEDPAAFTAANVGTAANNSWCAITVSLREQQPPPATMKLTALGVG